MSRSRVKSLAFGCASLGVVLVATAGANAGGFAIREQSATGQGSSFAGIAAGGALSSMYWNPAAMTQYESKAFEVGGAGIIPKASHTYTSSTVATTLGGVNAAYRNGADNSGDPAFVPSTYTSWQLTPQLWAGVAINTPYGLGVTFENAWAGARYATSSSLKSLNVSPSLAYKINDMISIAVGIQAQYMDVYYSGAVPGAGISYLSGKGYGFGYTLGATITPTATTKIGIGYRSAIDQDINGAKSGLASGSIYTTLNLPDLLSIGLRQGITDRLTLLAGYERQNWGRIGTAVVYNGNGTVATSLPFQYSDSWYASIGAEYVIDASWTVRAGIGFEKSPITDDVRTPRLPDNDRTWYSFGTSYKPAGLKGFVFDFGYSYIDVKDTPINITAASGNPWYVTAPGVGGDYVGSVSSHINIISVALRYQWDDVQAPIKQRYAK